MSNKRQPPYTTLSTSINGDTRQYHDRDSLPFEAVYPIVGFADDFITVGDSSEHLASYLRHNFWYQKANSAVRERILERTRHINTHLPIVLDFIKQRYGHIGLECVHISIGGSYIYSENPGDIDLDVVLTGSFFDYSYFNEGIEILDITNSISKVSLTVMGEDNISGKKNISSEISNEGFTHQDTILREMIVAPMRNVTVYGKPFDYEREIDSKNVLVRLARQLYFASLTLQGKIPYYKEDPLKTKKALSRINEAHDILEWLFLNSK